MKSQNAACGRPPVMPRCLLSAAARQIQSIHVTTPSTVTERPFGMPHPLLRTAAPLGAAVLAAAAVAAPASAAGGAGGGGGAGGAPASAAGGAGGGGGAVVAPGGEVVYNTASITLSNYPAGAVPITVTRDGTTIATGTAHVDGTGVGNANGARNGAP